MKALLADLIERRCDDCGSRRGTWHAIGHAVEVARSEDQRAALSEAAAMFGPEVEVWLCRRCEAFMVRWSFVG